MMHRAMQDNGYGIANAMVSVSTILFTDNWDRFKAYPKSEFFDVLDPRF
jgi:hypothetical protein